MIEPMKKTLLYFNFVAYSNLCSTHFHNFFVSREYSFHRLLNFTIMSSILSFPCLNLCKRLCCISILSPIPLVFNAHSSFLLNFTISASILPFQCLKPLKKPFLHLNFVSLCSTHFHFFNV